MFQQSTSVIMKGLFARVYYEISDPRKYKMKINAS